MAMTDPIATVTTATLAPDVAKVLNVTIRTASKITGLRTGPDTDQVAIALLNLALASLQSGDRPTEDAVSHPDIIED